jgi:tetratricopeptide (TPR) repeat protein
MIRHKGLAVALAGALALAGAQTIRAAAEAGQAQSALASDATLQQINLLLSRDDLPAARAAVTAALGEHPSDPAVHNLAGVIDAQSGAYAASEAHFETAIRLAPRGAAAYENLGRLYQERSLVDPSARPKALDTYRRLLEVQPSNVEALFQSGFLLALEGEFDRSHALIARLPPDVRQRPQALAVEAADSAGLGQPAAAADAVRRLGAAPQLTEADVLAVVPAFDHVANNEVLGQMLEALDRRGLASREGLQRLAAIEMRQQRYREARATFERAARDGGADVPLLLDLARAADKLDDHEGALGYLAHARELDPANATVHFLFGIVCVELNLGSEAYESLKKAVALAPEQPLVNYAMGAVSMHRREPSESLPYFEKYVRLAPDDPRGRFALGVARFYSGELDAAAADLGEAARHTETAAGAHYFLGRLARQSNDLGTARREIDAAVRLQPGYADAWAELGLIQTRAGDYGEAERSLGEAVRLDPDNYAAAVNLAVLYGRTKDPRQQAHAARLEALQEKRTARAQEFLRIIDVVR